MGSKEGRRRNDDCGNVKESVRSEPLAQSRGSVDLNGREGKMKEKKRKVDDVDRKWHYDGCRRRIEEEEERSNEAKEKNRRKKKKKNKIDVDEQLSERGDADIGSSGSGTIQRKKEEKDKEKKIQDMEEPRDDKGCADLVRVELGDGKVEEDIKKEKRKKKRIMERHQPGRGKDTSVSNGHQQNDEMVLVEQVDVEKGKENKKKRKQDEMEGERQAEEEQSEEETDGARKKRLVENKHVSRGTSPTMEVKFDAKCGGDKGNEKEVVGNFDCSEDIEDTREPAENLETTGCKKGKHGRKKNGASNMDSEEEGSKQSKCRGDERLECELAWTDAEDKGKLVKQGKKEKKTAEAVTSCLEGNG